MPISNPLASPLFLPALYVEAALFGGTLLLLLAMARLNLRRLASGTLFDRWRVWAIIAPLYTLAVLAGPLTTLALVCFLIVQGLREYSQLVALPPSYARALVCLGLALPIVAFASLTAFQFLPPVILVLATLQPLVLRTSGGVRHLAFSALGWGYIAWLLTHIVLIDRYLAGGPGIVLALGLGVALSDVGAFAIGSAFGRHKLAPRLSPNKTVEGVAGNVAGAYLGIGLMSFALPSQHHWLLAGVLPIVAGLGCLWGDLLESSIKREFAVKDAGNWLPGFGGLLDRIDSLIIVAPLVFYALRLVVPPT